jgi:hypothetical protein
VIHLLPKEIGGRIYSGVIIKDVRSQGEARWYLSSNTKVGHCCLLHPLILSLSPSPSLLLLPSACPPPLSLAPLPCRPCSHSRLPPSLLSPSLLPPLPLPCLSPSSLVAVAISHVLPLLSPSPLPWMLLLAHQLVVPIDSGFCERTMMVRCCSCDSLL